MVVVDLKILFQEKLTCIRYSSYSSLVPNIELRLVTIRPLVSEHCFKESHYSG